MCTTSVNTLPCKNSFITNDKSVALKVILNSYPEQLLVRVSNSSICKVEMQGLGVPSQSQLYVELNASLGCLKGSLKQS